MWKNLVKFLTNIGRAVIIRPNNKESRHNYNISWRVVS